MSTTMTNQPTPEPAAPKHAAWFESLDLDLEGELSPAHRDALETELAASPELRRERDLLTSLHAALAEDRISVRESFRDQVMASLPSTAWQAQGVRSWAAAAALTLALAASAVLVLGGGALAGLAEGAAVGTGVALVDFLAKTTLAGAGLLTASWRGVGFALEELIAESGLHLAGLAVLVLFVNLLFVSLLRRPAAAGSVPGAASEGGEVSSNDFGGAA